MEIKRSSIIILIMAAIAVVLFLASCTGKIGYHRVMGARVCNEERSDWYRCSDDYLNIEQCTFDSSTSNWIWDIWNMSVDCPARGEICNKLYGASASIRNPGCNPGCIYGGVGYPIGTKVCNFWYSTLACSPGGV